jgi:hypothetical protein
MAVFVEFRFRLPPWEEFEGEDMLGVSRRVAAGRDALASRAGVSSLGDWIRGVVGRES